MFKFPVAQKGKYFQKLKSRDLNFHGLLFRRCFDFRLSYKYTELAKKFWVILGMDIFVLPDIDYFVVFHFGCCTGEENGANGRIEER